MAVVMAEPAGGVKTLWNSLWDRQERRFALWIPVAIGCGIWLRLAFGVRAPLSWVVGLLVLSLLGLVAARRIGKGAPWLAAMTLFLAASGYCAAELRRAVVAAPVLEAPFHGEAEGRVLTADRSRSRAPRVVLDRLVLAGVHDLATPERARVTLVDAVDTPMPGTRIVVTAVLGAPAGPAAPGAFDFSRQAYFRQIGAVGYARGPVRVVESAGTETDLGIRLTRLRVRIAGALRKRIGGQEGAVAAALVVGDRSEIEDTTTQALRDSGLAHLLAISGLHIGLMSALTYWLVRLGLAAFPVFASRVPIRKIAALSGLLAAAVYLALSGFGVATQRAFIMAAVAFGAILIDRPAVTMRGLAVAACVVLLLRPESLFDAGFQMSFAAVAALVAAYDATRRFWRSRAERTGWTARLWTGLLATIMTSVVAGTATAPFAAYHFNRLVAYGLPANVLATPLMGLWIMPCIILTAALAPFGLEGVALAALGLGISYVLNVADIFSGLDGAVFGIPAGSASALALMTFGGLWLVIWRGGLRLFGSAFLIAGVFVWHQTERPDLLIGSKAKLIGGRTEDGALWISRERASSYAAELWLRRDGEAKTNQAAAHARRLWRCGKRRCEGETLRGWRIILWRSGKPAPEDCQPRTILIAPKGRFESPNSDCIVIDADDLLRMSSIALYLKDNGTPKIAAAESTRLSDQ